MTTLKVGDEVRLTGSFWQDEADFGPGDVVTVTRVTEDGTGVFSVEPGWDWYLETPAAEDEGWELVLAEGYVDTDAFLEIRFEDKVDAVLAEVKAKLIAKNNQYGNSALEPIRAFSKLNPVEQLLIRIDDKISRLQKGDGTGDEDAEADTLGYLILLAIARKDNR